MKDRREGAIVLLGGEPMGVLRDVLTDGAPRDARRLDAIERLLDERGIKLQ